MRSNSTFNVLTILIWCLFVVSPITAQNKLRGKLKAGAAKVDITPDKNDLPANSLGIHDPIHSRAIVMDNGVTRAALVSVEIAGMSEEQWKTITTRAESELGIPALNIMITCTHTHSAPRLATDVLVEKVFNSMKEAAGNLQEARMGYGSGLSYININRNNFDSERRTWWEGPNYDGVSDKTVAVIYFEKMDGTPLAVYYNYAMHAVVGGQMDKVSGDVPGAASRYIENSFDNQVVALWSTGACGDQNPVYFQQTFDLRDIRIRDYASRGEDISNAMPPGGTGLDRNNPEVARLMGEQELLLISMGQMLGEEVKYAIRNIKRFESNVSILSGTKTVSCPGRSRINSGRAGYEGVYEDTDPVEIRLCLLMVDDIPITSVNAEVFNQIAMRLKKESPYTRTMMATITNGAARSGYIPNDAAYGFQTFEVLSSRLKPGYAENAIVDGLLDLIHDATH